MEKDKENNSYLATTVYRVFHVQRIWKIAEGIKGKVKGYCAVENCNTLVVDGTESNREKER